MKLIKNGNIRGIYMTEQDLKIQDLKEENKKLKEELQKYEQSMERIVERLAEASFKDSSEVYNFWILDRDDAIQIVKEEGGIE